MAADIQATRKPLYSNLIFQVLVAILLGVLLGYFSPTVKDAAGHDVAGWAEKMKPLGEAFINLIKMMIAPIIFCTIVTGIAGMGNMKQAGRVGFKALIYFEVVSTLALIIGLVMVKVLDPGEGMHVVPTAADAAALQAKLSGKTLESTSDFFLHIIPNSFMGAFANGEILQVLLVSLLFAAAVTLMGDKGKPVVKAIDTFSHILFGIIGIIMKVAPIGAFGAMAFTIGKYGIGSIQNLGALMLDFYGTCIFFVIVVLGGILSLCRINIFQFIKFLKEELMIIVGTSSSETVLPRMLDKMTHLGCAKPVVGMVIPTGYSFNLDGTAIYLTMAAIFIGQATDIPLSLSQELTLLGILLLTSKGAAGVTGSGFVVLAATLASVNPALVPGLALILGIDPFMSRGRALTNLIGNAVATVVVAKWENAFDHDRAKAILAGEKDPELETEVDLEKLV